MRPIANDSMTSESERTGAAVGRTGPSRTTHDSAADRGYRILIAEDDPAMRELLVQALRSDGHDVYEAEDGMGLFCYFDEDHGPDRPDQFFGVDLIISDIRMPWLTGLEVLREIKARKEPIPIILITAFGDDTTHAEAERLGAVAVVDKPFDVDEFVAMVRRMLSDDAPTSYEHPP